MPMCCLVFIPVVICYLYLYASVVLSHILPRLVGLTGFRVDFLLLTDMLNLMNPRAVPGQRTSRGPPALAVPGR